MRFGGGVRRKYLKAPTVQKKVPSRLEDQLLLQLQEGWAMYCSALIVSHGGAFSSKVPDQHFGAFKSTRFAWVCVLTSWSSTAAGNWGASYQAGLARHRKRAGAESYQNVFLELIYKYVEIVIPSTWVHYGQQDHRKEDCEDRIS